MVTPRRAVVAAGLLLFSVGLAGLPADRAISQYVRRSWTVEQGLPHGTVRGFAQTADGYLWLATYEGVVRFNGEAFRIFDKVTNAELPNSSILTTHRTGSTVWFGTVAGLVRLQGEQFVVVAGENAPTGLVSALEDSPDGTLWAGGADGLRRVQNGQARPVALPQSADTVSSLLHSDDGALWVGMPTGLGVLEDGAVHLSPLSKSLSGAAVLTLCQGEPGELYVGTAAGLDRIRNGTVEHVAGLPADQVTALLRDGDANLWVGTYSNGLFRLHDGEVSQYGLADGLLNPTVRAIFEDADGSIWVGTNRGFEQLRGGPFLTWTSRHGLGDDFARAVFQDSEGTVWAGTANGLSRMEGDRWVRSTDPRLANAYVLSIAQSRDGTRWYGTSNGLIRERGGLVRVFTMADGLPSNSVRAIFEDRHGDVWVATDSGPLRIRPGGALESFSGTHGLGTHYAVAFAETPDGTLWVGTGGGLARFDGTGFELRSAPRDFPSNRIFAMVTDAAGTLWIGTDGDGVVRFRDGISRVVNSSHGLPYDKILSMTSDPDGLWFGTARGAFRVQTRQMNAVADRTSSRISSRMFDESDGLGSRQCNGSGSPAATRTRDGRVWFATANGVSAFAGAMTPASGKPRPPVVERVLVDGRPVSRAALAAVPPGSDRIEIEFTGVTFIAPERMSFRYRLEGYDNAWSDAGENRVISYTNLPAGSYQFILESIQENGERRSASMPVRLRPHFYETPWFVALAGLSIAALLLFVHRFRLHLMRENARRLEDLVAERTREIREEKERTELARQAAEEARRQAEHHEEMAEQALVEAEQANRAKSTLLATTSHELRTPLNAIIGFSDILMTRAAERLDARQQMFLHNIHSSGEYLLGIINNILDLSKIESGKMEFQPEPVFLRETVHGICGVMKGVTTMRKIHIELDIPEGLPNFEADPSQIKQILYNLMSNAVKFSPERSTVTVSARVADGGEGIEIRVIDEGVGIDPKDHQVIFQEFRQANTGGKRPEGTGLGLALVRRFVAMHGGSVRVESEPGKGSRFIVALPMRQHDSAGSARNGTDPLP